jgi:iron(III) transport system substrate-binding protein
MSLHRTLRLALAGLVGTALLSACGTSSGGASSKLVIYTGSGTEVTKPLLDGFAKEHPEVKISIVKAGAGELLARVAAEKSNPGGDLLLGAEPTAFNADPSLFAAYKSPHDAEMIAQDPANIWHAWGFMPQAILVNTRLLKNESDWPKTLDDLADSKWSGGKIALADPSKSGTGSAIVAGLVAAKDWDFISSIAKNVSIASGSDAMFDAVKNGSKPVGFINEDLGAKWEAAKLPVKMIFPSDGVTNNIDAYAIIKGAKHEKNAKLLVDYLGSEDATKIMAGEVLRRSTRKDAPTPKGLSDLSKFNLIDTKDVPRDDLADTFASTIESAR